MVCSLRLTSHLLSFKKSTWELSERPHRLVPTLVGNLLAVTGSFGTRIHIIAYLIFPALTISLYFLPCVQVTKGLWSACGLALCNDSHYSFGGSIRGGEMTFQAQATEEIHGFPGSHSHCQSRSPPSTPTPWAGTVAQSTIL